MADDPPLSEAEIIRRYFVPLADQTPGAFALLDDAAFMAPETDRGLVVTMDMLVAGVHFRDEDRPDHVAQKALAVNLSDLAAKGAEPLIYFLSLALPSPARAAWLEAFAAGLEAAQAAHGCRLGGGDTVATPGPLSLSITAIGRAGEAGMVPRTAARPGDKVYVTGTIGDAALGLRLLSDDGSGDRWALDTDAAAFLRNRYWLPEPRLAMIPALRAHVSAAMDVSDGLIGDLAKLCAASGVGSLVEAAKVPLSGAARAALAAEPALLEGLLTGGDDYEILATVPPTEAGKFERTCCKVGVAVACIGTIVEPEAGVTVLGPDGRPLALEAFSYDHFA